MQNRELPEGWDAGLPTFPASAKGLASRESSGKVLNAIAPHYPWLIGGAADLAPSTKTRLTFEGAGDLEADTPGGRNLHFGVREHAMGAILNGLALSKIRAYGSGFLIFSDYMKPPIRLGALMELPVIYVFTHDSIGVGQDGPTHQPVEQLIALRTIPGLITLRPADANEVVEAWRVIIGLEHQPACLVLSRQPLPTFDRTRYAPAAGVSRGAYVLAEAENGKPAVILIGTGSEVALCIKAYEELKQEGIPARVVSMPSWELFEQQDQIVPRSCSPARRHGARVGGDGLRDRLGPICRYDWRQDRHAHFRLLGAAQGPAHQNSASLRKRCLLQRKSRSRKPEGNRDEIRRQKESRPESAQVIARPWTSRMARLSRATLHRRRRPQEARRGGWADRRYFQSHRSSKKRSPAARTMIRR